MSTPPKKYFRLVHAQARKLAAEFCLSAPEGWVVTVAEPTRNLDQNAKFHALCGDIAKSGFPWCGKPRTSEQWKVLMVSGHAVVTKEGSEMVPGLENEFVNLRESTALMSIKRSASLIEYVVAFCIENDILCSNKKG